MQDQKMPTGDYEMYAIAFDLDTDELKKNYSNPSWNNAYKDIANELTARGFSWQQGSVYFGSASVDPTDCVLAVQALSLKYAWFKPSVKDIRMLRIEANHDLKKAI